MAPNVLTGFCELLALEILFDGERNEGIIISTCVVRQISKMFSGTAVATDLKR